MMTARLERAPASSEVRQPGLLAPARWLLNRHLGILWWFLGMVVLVFGFAYPAIGRSGATLPFSIWETFAANGPGWLILAMGATAVTTYLPMLVANGLTRGRFTLVATLALAGCALILAAVIAAGFVYESYMFGRSGWPHTLNGDHLFPTTSHVHLVVVEYAVRYLSYGLAGLLAGYGFYRAGGWWGTALLPFTVIVPLGVSSALFDLRVGGGAFSWAEAGQRTALGLGVGGASGTGLALASAFAIVLLVVTMRLMSRLPIRSKAA